MELSEKSTLPSRSRSFNLFRSVSDYLALGYLYLLLLGIASDSIFYGLLGINIISYSSVLDVLLSPIARITSNLVIPILVIVLPVFSFFYLKLIRRIQEKKSQKNNKPNKLMTIPLQTLWIFFSALIIFSAFIGYGFGGGSRIKERMHTSDLRLEHRIMFINKERVDVELVGNNSGYVFYIEAGNRHVTASPIPGNIQKIERINK
jgi:heme/copper-type cytochrome/quinol oxidase subunit 2